MSDRMPPNDRRAEQDVLGSILADNAAYSEIVLTVPRPEFFYSFAHQQIFRAMLALIQAGKVADCTTIPDWLRTNRVDLAEIGGIGYLGDLWGTAGAGAGSAEIVKKKFIARQLIHACNELAALAYEPAATADELLEVAEKKIFSISELGIAGRTQTFAEVGQEFLDEMDRRAGRKDGEVFESFVATGFPGLDQMIAGLFKSELTILAARPSQGKTLVGTCIAKNVAKRGHAVLFACMEQRSIEIFSRCVSAEGMIPSHFIRDGRLDHAAKERFHAACDRLMQLPIHMDQTPRQSTMYIGATARRLLAKAEIKLIVVDYLQLVEPESRRDERHEQIDGVARRLKLMARELDIPVVALAQINRKSEDRIDRVPRLADLKGSGGIEEHADCVILLHKPEAPDVKRPFDALEMRVEKCRNGPTGMVHMVHDKEHFAVLEQAHGENPFP